MSVKIRSSAAERLLARVGCCMALAVCTSAQSSKPQRQQCPQSWYERWCVDAGAPKSLRRGTCAFEGRPAFEGVPLPLLSYQVAHQELRPPLSPSCPPALADLMQHCWQHDPKARPAMADVLRSLRETLLAYLHRDGVGGSGSPLSQ